MVDIISQPEVLEGVKQREQLFRDGLEAIQAKYPIIDEVRGKGLLLGLALTEEWRGRAKDIYAAAIEHGLFVLVAGANVVRLTPSLIITESDIKEGLDKLEAAIASLVKTLNEPLAHLVSGDLQEKDVCRSSNYSIRLLITTYLCRRIRFWLHVFTGR